MALLLLLVATACGVAVGIWRGNWGWEMLTATERSVVMLELLGIATVAVFIGRKRVWILPVLSLALVVATAFNLFESRFHMQFGANGVTCMLRSWPAAFVCLAAVFLCLRTGKWQGSLIAAGVLAASSAILAQTIYCPIVETRHMSYFHAGQFVFWGLVIPGFLYRVMPAVRNMKAYSNATSRNLS